MNAKHSPLFVSAHAVINDVHELTQTGRGSVKIYSPDHQVDVTISPMTMAVADKLCEMIRTAARECESETKRRYDLEIEAK